MNHFLCSLGSNVSPRQNLADAVVELVSEFGCVTFSPLIRTEPVELSTCNRFINGLFSFRSELEPSLVKTIFNRLEMSHGRNRNDPHRSEKDRPLDLDIESCQKDGDFSGVKLDCFLQSLLPCMLGEAQVSDAEQAILLSLEVLGGALEIGQVTTTVDLDTISGHTGI